MSLLNKRFRLTLDATLTPDQLSAMPTQEDIEREAKAAFPPGADVHVSFQWYPIYDTK